MPCYYRSFTLLRSLFVLTGLLLLTMPSLAASLASSASLLEHFKNEISLHPDKNGVYILEHGEEALIARAGLVNNAQHSIDVQYFIWSTDNVGKLAAEALLRAAERGVHVRVIVDDLLIDAPDKSLLALARHSNIEIKIYNPKHSVGTPRYKQVMNMLSDFRGFNQRMHDKTLIVDDTVLITGGRNMADEYFDYNQDYNFRDRDALIVGRAAHAARQSFERFWTHKLSVPVEELFDGWGILQKHVAASHEEIQAIYRSLHEYARQPENFPPEIRSVISAASQHFAKLNDALIWSEVEFISDRPGKNEKIVSLGGGGNMSNTLSGLLHHAQQQILIQSPYVVLTRKTMKLFRALLERGVTINISTNSLAATDNLQAFSGYRNQRKKLLRMGINLFEYKNNPHSQKILLKRFPKIEDRHPTFAIHAKTLIIDRSMLYVGTFNLDPRSINLNTEVGVIIQNEALARQAAERIENDMKPENSWNSHHENPDRYAPLLKKIRMTFWRLMPIKALL